MRCSPHSLITPEGHVINCGSLGTAQTPHTGQLGVVYWMCGPCLKAGPALWTVQFKEHHSHHRHYIFVCLFNNLLAYTSKVSYSNKMNIREYLREGSTFLICTKTLCELGLFWHGNIWLWDPPLQFTIVHIVWITLLPLKTCF